MHKLAVQGLFHDIRGKTANRRWRLSRFAILHTKHLLQLLNMLDVRASAQSVVCHQDMRSFQKNQLITHVAYPLNGHLKTLLYFVCNSLQDPWWPVN